MAIANIESETQQIKSAVYGEDVRGAIVSALNKINTYVCTAVNSGTDLNTVTGPGAYDLWGAYTNGPVTSIYGTLEVMAFHPNAAGNYYLTQRVVIVSSNTDPIHEYIRRFNRTAWSAWVTIY